MGELLQERFMGSVKEPKEQTWRHNVSVIMMNRTTADQAEPCIRALFKRWPTCQALSLADYGPVATAIKSAGFSLGRATALVHMSRKMMHGYDRPEDLPGIGEYGANSYRMFVHGDLSVDPKDKKLQERKKELLACRT